MEFLVEFEVEIPAGTPDAEVEQHQRRVNRRRAQRAAALSRYIRAEHLPSAGREVSGRRSRR